MIINIFFLFQFHPRTPLFTPHSLKADRPPPASSSVLARGWWTSTPCSRRVVLGGAAAPTHGSHPKYSLPVKKHKPSRIWSLAELGVDPGWKMWFAKIGALASNGLIPWVVFYPSNVQTWSLWRWEKCYRPCNADSLRFLIFPRIYYFWHIWLWLHFHNHLELISCLVLTNNSSSLVVIHFPFEFCILADWTISFNKFSILEYTSV